MLKNDKKNDRKDDRKAVIIAVLIILILAAGSSFFALVLPAFNQSAVQVEKLPRIVTGVKSVDGKLHQLTVDLSLHISKGEKIDEEKIIEDISGLLSGLSYENVTDADGLDLIKSEVRAYLEENLSANAEFSIYVPNMLNDYTFPEEEQSSPRDEIFRELFKNSK